VSCLHRGRAVAFPSSQPRGLATGAVQNMLHKYGPTELDHAEHKITGIPAKPARSLRPLCRIEYRVVVCESRASSLKSSCLRNKRELLRSKEGPNSNVKISNLKSCAPHGRL